MQKLISPIWIKITIFLMAFVNSGCSASMEIEETISIRGNNNAYSIPSKYTKPSSSILHIYLEGGDKSASTALLISDIDDPNLGSDFLFYLLLIHDKSYMQEKVLLDASKSVSKKSSTMAEVDSLYLYQDGLGGNVKNYYFSFNPLNAVPSSLNRKDFYARIKNTAGLDIEGITTVPKPSCQIYSVYDGILIQATVVDSVCLPSNLTKLKNLQDKLMESWRSD